MRLLVITRAAWKNNNNIGNTLSDLFSGLNAEIFSLCFRDEIPSNSLSKSNFAVSEGQIIKHLKNSESAVGMENSVSAESETRENEVYNAAKKAGGLTVFLQFAREFLWDTGVWKSESLKRYIEKVDPDIIFMPVFNCYYPHKVLRYIHTLTDAKIVLFHADDNYSLKKFSLNPIYWIYRLGLRKNIRKSVEISSKNYVISDLQKREYEKAFKTECKLLTKSALYSDKFCVSEKENCPLELIYTGNLSVGRWKTLSLIKNALKNINENGKKAILKIYSYTELKSEQLQAMADGDNSVFMGGIPAEQIAEIQKNADILVYPESFSFKEKLEVRQSFSTKIVDYLCSSKPILAIGPEDIASIGYFAKKNAALTVTDKKEIEKCLLKLIENKDLRREYAEKAYECGKQNHNAAVIKNDFYNDLMNL